jgi:plastocyanin
MHRALITGLAISASVALAACSGAASPTAAPPSPAASVATPSPAASVAAPSPAASIAASMAASPAASQAPAASDAITIQNFAFAPASLTVKSGATVTWTNMDSPKHSVKWDDGTTGSDPLSTGATYTRTFATAGTFTYVCGIHASMKGTIVVN